MPIALMPNARNWNWSIDQMWSDDCEVLGPAVVSPSHYGIRFLEKVQGRVSLVSFLC
jgi:hypothetical protein